MEKLKISLWSLALVLGVTGIVIGIQAGDGFLVVGSFFFIATALVLTN